MITEVNQGLGEWHIRLRENTPKELTDLLAVNQFGHIAFLPGRLDVKALGDGMLASARYVGGSRKHVSPPREYEIKGYGLNWWLGDADNRGDIFSDNVSFSGSTYAQAVRRLLPSSGSITEGTIHSIGGSATFTGNVRWDTPRDAINRVSRYFTTDSTDPVEWRVNNNGTLDAGKASQLYPAYANPNAILVRRADSGRDLRLVGIESELSLDSDSEDYLTHAYVVGQGEGDAAPVGSASAAPTPYRHLFNAPIRIAVVESDTEASAAEVTALAGVVVSESSALRQAAQINTDEFDVKGTFGIGDGIWVFDPRTGFTNPNNEVFWQGQPVNPVRLRVTEMTYPVPSGWTVAFRANDGSWHDLSNYYAPESGGTSIVVGDYLNRLDRGFGEALDGRATPDTSIPGVPVFGTFYTGSYESLTGDGSRAQIQLSWTKPNNTDGSTLIDLAHYEIRFRPNTQNDYPATHAAMTAVGSYAGLFTHGQPVIPPLNALWQTVFVGPDVTTFMLQELTPRVAYDFQIRAVDTASPPNAGAWSGTTPFTAAQDTTAPNQPAPPSVAGSRISVQVTHALGSSAGGTFNLASDLDHLEFFLGGSTHFECNNGNRIGKLTANAGMMQGQIPAVGTFPIEPVDTVYIRCIAVDRTGNRSTPSDAATVTARLVDNAHISDLTVSKVTAGTITATWLMAGTIQTAASGIRAGLDSTGFFAYNAKGVRTFDVSAATGNVTSTGVFQTGTAGQRIVISDEEPFSQIKFYGSRDAGDFAAISAVDFKRGEDNFVGILNDTNNWIDSDGILSKTRMYMVDFAIMQCIDALTQTQRGGGFYLDPAQARLSYVVRPSDTGTDQSITMDKNSTFHFGTWPDYVDFGANQGIFSGHILTGSNVTSTSIGYGTTRASTTYPICTIRDNQAAANINRWQVNAADTTSWTVEFGAATAGVAEVWFWGFRV